MKFRENLLMRAVEVDRQGNYKRTAHEKFTYGSMIMMRVGFVQWYNFKLIYVTIRSYESLSKALTIAIRYSAIRRQFPQELDSGIERV